jgi:hypothetical protein
MDEETRRARIAANESVFRDVNERIEDLSKGPLTALSLSEMEIVCECGDISCAQAIEVDHATYEQVRSDPTLFIVAPGHSVDDVEDIVSRHDGFDIVCKHKGAGYVVAEEADPRS